MHRPPPARAYERRTRSHGQQNATHNKPTRHQKHHRDTTVFSQKARKRSGESCNNSDTSHVTTPTSPTPNHARPSANTVTTGHDTNNARDKHRPAVTRHDTRNPHKRAHSFTATDHGQRTCAYLPAPPLRMCIQTVNTTTSMRTNDPEEESAGCELARRTQLQIKKLVFFAAHARGARAGARARHGRSNIW